MRGRNPRRAPLVCTRPGGTRQAPEYWPPARPVSHCPIPVGSLGTRARSSAATAICSSGIKRSVLTVELPPSTDPLGVGLVSGGPFWGSGLFVFNAECGASVGALTVRDALSDGGNLPGDICCSTAGNTTTIISCSNRAHKLDAVATVFRGHTANPSF